MASNSDIDDCLSGFGAATQAWFRASFAAPSPIQQASWPVLRDGENALLLAPTGSGKTLAAFLASIDKLLHAKALDRGGPRLLYISPIKALAYDIERNLREPLLGIVETSETALAPLRVDVRTGDTSPADRRKQLKNPGDILITTPESLYLLLGGQARETLRGVETVIIDEIHAIASSKRGVHLALSLERLDKLCKQDVQRVGLSATQRPLQRVANFLGGDRSVSIIDCATLPQLDLDIIVPVADMENPFPKRDNDAEEGPREGLWAAIVPHLLTLIRANTTTLLFCNSRRLAERIAQALNELANDDLTRAHHGSVARHQRQEMEEQLKRGELRALVATSSLELGIDMSTVDLVIQIESPGSVARGLQRVGRAGHAVGIRSHGIIVPKFRGDLLEATVVGKRMQEGAIEETHIPRNCLDVLAQQIVAMCSVEDWTVSALKSLVRRCDCYRQLSDDAFEHVLDMLSGHYPSDELQDLVPRIRWDRQQDQLSARKGAKMMSLINGGTIPDRGLYAVHLGVKGPRIGELDEEMVYEARAGETFFLGASTWRILEITRDQVIVAPAPGETGKMPFWHGDGPGRPPGLARALGEFCQEFSEPEDQEDKHRTLVADYRLNPEAATNLLRYLQDQRSATGVIPSDCCIVVERFRDEVGDWRICILTPYGARVHAPWALAIRSKIGGDRSQAPQILWTDDGIALHLPDSGQPPDLSLLLPSPGELRELVIEELAGSAMFASHFRENAARALLLPRRRPGKRTPLWLQRLKSQNLLSVAKRYPSFPIIIETYRECMQEVFDLDACTTLLQSVADGSTRVEQVETKSPSPFARSLVFSYIATFLYETDAPAAERRAQALSLDRELLRQLLGTEKLREFLDAEVIAELESELQCTADDRRARDADEVHDLLRRLGSMTLKQIQDRCEGPASVFTEELVRTSRACSIKLAGTDRIIASEDAARYQAAMGIELPSSLPTVFLDTQVTAQESMRELVMRFARRHGAFIESDLAANLGIEESAALSLLQGLEEDGSLEHNELTPGREGLEWCHPEILKNIRRRSLERLRAQIAPVSAAAYAAFLADSHGIANPSSGVEALRAAITRLGGQPLPWSEVETRILPARVADYRPEMLDHLCASGEVVWIGAGKLGVSDGRVRLVLRRQAIRLLDPPAALPTDAPLQAKNLDQELQERGASFLVALDSADTSGLDEALAYLVWQGRITNDTVSMLRTLKSRPRGGRAQGRKRAAARGGRWSSTQGVLGTATETERLHAKTHALLHCYGVVSRNLGPVVGGFGEVARVLRGSEELGKLRRGHFVSDLQGSQYALAGVVESLRRSRETQLQVLAACDPANPWGSIFPWPRSIGTRRAGATIICAGGEPVCFLDSGNRKLSTYQRGEVLDRVIASALPLLTKGKTLRLTHIDGETVRKSALTPRLCNQGFRLEAKTLVFERYR